MSPYLKATATFGSLLFLLLGASAAYAQQGKTRAEIEAANQALISSVARGDAAAVADAYTPGGQMFPANSGVVSGRPAIQELWQSWITAGFTNLTLEVVELEGFGDTAYEVGKYTMPGKDGKLLDAGKYIVIWKREGGQWKLHRDIWTTDMPASTQ